MQNELLSGDDLAKRLGLTWSHAVLFKEQTIPEIHPDRTGKHFEIILPFEIDAERNYASLCELMVKAKMAELVDPQLAATYFHPDTDFSDAETLRRAQLLQRAQQWTDIWMNDNMASRLGPDVAKKNLQETMFFVSEITDDFVKKVGELDVTLLYITLGASIQRMQLVDDPIIGILFKQFDTFLEMRYGPRDFEQTRLLTTQLAQQIPQMSLDRKTAITDYEEVTQALLPVIGATFSARLVEHDGHNVWMIEQPDGE